MFSREWRNWQTRTFEGRVVHPYGFKSRLSHQKIDKFRLVDFLFIAKQWYIIAARRVVHIISPFGLYIITRQCVYRLRNDDIQFLAELVIYSLVVSISRNKRMISTALP